MSLYRQHRYTNVIALSKTQRLMSLCTYYKEQRQELIKQERKLGGNYERNHYA